ncbi:E2 [Pygoscelis adeliae papillomavirus 1]|uniref:Regulatory protein E2 n=1 Tax=Pygoscelis adeliae papillomavirus 1 TaxID=1480065 RepID=X2JL96_9PAPI|nr:E2 [Pygoscelis adeliae papillomavirus 1]AHN65802.1 E2 [Pygoscelis adeliae papillomavirus 1]
MTMANLERLITDLQSKETDLLEKEHQTLQDVTDYWGTVRKLNTVFTAATRSGLTRVGLQKLPPTATTEQEAKDAIGMHLLCQSLSRSPFGKLPWTLSDIYPLLFKKPPEGLKRSPGVVTVTYCNDPDTETEYPYWKDLYFYDMGRDLWTQGDGGYDGHGLWYSINGGARTYYLKWQEEATMYCGGGGVTWTLVPPPSAVDDIDGTAPPLFESPQASPSPPDLTRYSPDSPEGGEIPGTSVPQPRSHSTPKAQTRQKRRAPAVKAPAPKRPKKGTRQPKRAAGVAPSDVGGVRHTVSGQHGASRLDRLLDGARDPPAVCYTGQTGQLKTIRYRLQAGPYTFERVSSTWHWLNGPETESKLLVTFKDETDRKRFIDTFNTSASGVRLTLCSISGL